MKYCDELPFKSKVAKKQMYVDVLNDFNGSGKAFAMVEEGDVPLTGGRHRFDADEYRFDAEYTAYNIGKVAKEMFPHIRVMRRGGNVYLINTEYAKEWDK